MSGRAVAYYAIDIVSGAMFGVAVYCAGAPSWAALAVYAITFSLGRVDSAIRLKD